MIKGFTSASRGVGDSLANKLEFRNLLLGESLKISSKILEKKGSERTERTMKQFIEKQNDYIRLSLKKLIQLTNYIISQLNSFLITRTYTLKRKKISKNFAPLLNCLNLNFFNN